MTFEFDISKKVNWPKTILVVILLLFSYALRIHLYPWYPQRGATSDEYTYSFLGVSLLTQGVPISWSSFEAYPKITDLTIDHIYFPMVKPYFDHPPLYGLLVGGWAVLNGQTHFEQIKLSTIRLIPIWLSMISTLLVFLISKKIFDFKTAIFALLIYATTTTFVMNGRVAVSENLVAVWFLLASYLLVQYQNKLNTRLLIILGSICGLSFWTQTISMSLFFALGFAFLYKKISFQKLIPYILAFAFFIALYLLYAWHYDFSLFWQLQKEQSLRPIGPQTFWYIFSTPIIVNKVYLDGWYLFSFLALFFSFSNLKNKEYLFIPFFYILFLVLTLTERGQSGWYIIPLFPFMAVAAAELVKEAIQKRSLLFSSLLFIVGLLEINAWYRHGVASSLFRIFLGVLFVPFLLSFLPKNDRWYRFTTQFIFYLLIAVNTFLTWHYVHPS